MKSTKTYYFEASTALVIFCGLVQMFNRPAFSEDVHKQYKFPTLDDVVYKVPVNLPSLARNAKIHLWTKGKVPYEFGKSVTANQKVIFLKACKLWEKAANVNFQRCKNDRCTVRNYITVVTSKSGNPHSLIGMVGGPQKLVMTKQAWADGNGVYIACHEIAHALGVDHEQSRLDRDSYVKIYPENIKKGNENNFEKWKNPYNKGPYDYDSVLHYAKNAFGKTGPDGNPLVTIQVLQGDPNGIGQRDHLSKIDQSGMAMVYGQPH